MQKGGEGFQIACTIAYVFNGRPHRAEDSTNNDGTEDLTNNVTSRY